MPNLLDTNVVSELPKPRPNPNVLKYIANQLQEHLFLSSVTIAEVRFGILIATDEIRKRLLEVWLEDEIRAAFAGRILPITETVLVRWRVLTEEGRSSGRTFSQPDLLIASTALEHGLTLVTRNTKDFHNISGLQLVNPWESRP